MPQATGLRSLSAGITGHSVVTDARKYLGIPYLWGGTDPSKGLDCSGLVQLVYHDLGYSLPRGAADQARQGQPVARLADARPGDLLAFGSPVHHIAIYIGNGKVIEAPHTGANVRVSDVYETPTAIRRIIPAVSAASSSNSLSLLLQRAQSGLPLSSAQLSALRADLESR
jgi:cell wall-associated NlpC family hydrolase